MQNFKIFLNTVLLSSLLSLANAMDYSAMTAQQKGEALVKAARYGDFKAVENLVNAGAPVNFKDEDGCMALHWAAYNKNFKVGKFLIGVGADVNAQTRDKNTPLILLLMGVEKIKLRLNVFYDKNAKVFNILDPNRFEEVLVKIPLDGAKKIFSENLNTFLASDASGKCELLILTLDGKKYLFFNLENSDPKKRALAEYEDEELQKSDLEYWVNRIEFMEFLLKSGAKVNIQNKRKETALLFAATDRGMEKCKLLLEYGARKDLADENGLYPVDFISGANKELLDMLMPDGVASVTYFLKLLFRQSSCCCKKR